ncbi:hypothetical protein SLEP1_g13812 [Rubroshorea leprosula]|uniref:carbonic anhydrase n=1 Tax=Rubroshorea leprosula TaxID=152421 RepID=A0AAV5IH57_9ROSI|nr:hypothetical protein SLEP1_g13812 [Rubroshorea leprosula]
MDKKLSTCLFNCIIFFFVVLVLLSSQATSEEFDDEREFDYNKNGEKGPNRWGQLKPEWSACGNGTMQSPVDLLNERVEIVSYLGRLKMSYKPSNATLKNRGHGMKLSFENEAGNIEINGTEYELKQLHWHSPSEHTIDGFSLDLELHMVHESQDGQVAVVGIMYKIGRPDSFLLSLKDHLENITDTTEKESYVGVIDPRDIKIGSGYYRYLGSLTIPPCTENVVWTIVRKVQTVTREQVRVLRVAVHDESNTNARPVQPINKRTVQLYKPDEMEN